MPAKSILLLSALLILTISAAAQPSTQILTTAEGSKIEIILKPLKETIMLGETTYINFEVTNFSERNICMTVGGDYRNNVGRPDSYKVSVVRDDGKAVPQPEVKISLGGLIGCAPLKPLETYITRLFLPHWATFSEPGTYKIAVRKNLSLHTEGASSKTFYPAEVGTTINVIPTDQAKLGEVIDALGKTIDGSSVSILGFIDDPRTIKHLAPILEKYDDPFFVRPAARAISKYDTEEAWKALEKAASNPDDEVRYAVADALDSSKYSKALKLLLTMKNDSYWLVRLRVVQGFGKIKTEESTALLREMLKDENKDVREQARMFLDQRGQK